MKRKSFLISGILVIAFIFLFSPAYIAYQQLIEVDFLSCGEKYEDRDMEGLSLDKQLNLISDSGPFSSFSLLAHNLFASIARLSFQIPSSESKPFTLRC